VPPGFPGSREVFSFAEASPRAAFFFLFRIGRKFRMSLQVFETFEELLALHAEARKCLSGFAQTAFLFVPGCRDDMFFAIGIGVVANKECDLKLIYIC